MHELSRLIITAVTIMGVCLTGCSQSNTAYTAADASASPPPQISSVKPAASSKIQIQSEPSGAFEAPAESSPSTITEPVVDQTSTAKQTSVDIDLTKFNANILYAEIYNMGLSPEDYKGKVLKLTGEFAHFPKEVDKNGIPTSDEEIYVCMINDAMACCAIGIEFIPEKESSFWTNFPEDGSKITITGLCDIFLDESGWFTIIQLNNAAVEQSK